jgi:hypothetical protein
MIRPTKYAPEKAEIAIVATLKTKTVTGKSELTYSLGKDDIDTPYIRIFQNTGNGFFSNEWLPLNAIIDILEGRQGAAFSSTALEPLFRGKSVNTPGFLAAVLLKEKVLELEQEKSRKYIYRSAVGILAKIEKGKSRKVIKKAAPKPATKKAATKKS